MTIIGRGGGAAMEIKVTLRDCAFLDALAREAEREAGNAGNTKHQAQLFMALSEHLLDLAETFPLEGETPGATL